MWADRFDATLIRSRVQTETWFVRSGGSSLTSASTRE